MVYRFEYNRLFDLCPHSNLMVEDLKTVLEGKATLIKNRQYLSTKEYLNPFVERLSPLTNRFICQVKPADQISTTGSTTDTVYNKVLLTAILPDSFDVNGVKYNRVVNMAYALDTKVPVAKFYTGVIDPSYRFYQFGRGYSEVQKIEVSNPLDFSKLMPLIERSKADSCEKMLTGISQALLNKGVMTRYLGDWIDFTLTTDYYIEDVGKVKLANSLPITTYSDVILNKDSNFYSDAPNVAISTLYESFAEQISEDEKDLINRYEKTMLINEMLKL